MMIPDPMIYFLFGMLFGSFVHLLCSYVFKLSGYEQRQIKLEEQFKEFDESLDKMWDDVYGSEEDD